MIMCPLAGDDRRRHPVRTAAAVLLISLFIAAPGMPRPAWSAETAAEEQAPRAAPANEQLHESEPTAEEVAKAAAAAKAQEEALKEAEYKEKREKEKQEQMVEAQEFVHSADETVISRLPYPLNAILGESVFDITIWRYLASLGLIFAAVALILFISRRFRKASRAIADRSASSSLQLAADVAILALRTPLKIITVGLLMRGISSLLVTKHHPDILWLSDMIVFLGFVWYFYDLAGIVDEVYGNRIFHINNRLMETVRPIILKGVRLFILIIAGMHIYQDITGKTMVSVLAGLGIGGLALALASQETLRNLLGFASIAFDRAFLVGDSVTIADYDGTIEHVGIRSLRLRTFAGESVVIPNNTAINSNIVNSSRRPYIRREIRIHLSPLNPYAKVDEAMAQIREAVTLHDGRVPGLEPVVRFVDFEPARFVLQAYFWYDAEKTDYYDECSRVNLEIARRLSDAGIIYAER